MNIFSDMPYPLKEDFPFKSLRDKQKRYHGEVELNIYTISFNIFHTLLFSSNISLRCALSYFSLV